MSHGYGPWGPQSGHRGRNTGYLTESTRDDVLQHLAYEKFDEQSLMKNLLPRRNYDRRLAANTELLKEALSSKDNHHRSASKTDSKFPA